MVKRNLCVSCTSSCANGEEVNDLIEIPAFITKDAVYAIAQTLEQQKDEGETAKHRHLVLEFCKGNGVDLGSAGVPVVPWAIQVDLPTEDYRAYNPTRGEAPIHWRGSALDLPFKDETLDFCHASHIVEDFEEWDTPLSEWGRVLKVGGMLIIAIPDHERFRARVRRAMDEHGLDLDNCSHKSEHLCHVGALTDRLITQYDVLFDGFINDHPEEYSILFCGRKK